MRIIAIIGVPASGKTELVRGMLHLFREGFSHGLLHGHCDRAGQRYLLGIYRGWDFDGTDQLSFRAVVDLRAWLPTLPEQAVVIFEGDRFAQLRLLQELLAIHQLTVVLIDASPETLSRRRDKRAKKTGKPQDKAWLAGRTTKVNRIAGALMGHVLRWENNTKDEQARNLAKLCALIGVEDESFATKGGA